MINVSLPVRIFEARSFIERMTDVWGYAPVRCVTSFDPDHLAAELTRARVCATDLHEPSRDHQGSCRADEVGRIMVYRR